MTCAFALAWRSSDGCFSTSDTTPWSCAWTGATGSTPACGAARVLVRSISVAGARSDGSRCRVRARRSRIAPATPKAALRRPPRAGQSKARKMASCCTSRVCRLSRCDHPCRPARGRRGRARRASPKAEPGAGSAGRGAAQRRRLDFHIRPDSAVDQTRAFRMSLHEKPTVSQTADHNTMTCANAGTMPDLGRQ